MLACAASRTPVGRYGALSVKEGRLVGRGGKPVQLRGMSTMGLQWYGEIVNDEAFKALALDWKADVIRLALYVGEGGYAKRPSLKELVKKGIRLAVDQGLYVIVDWHVLTPGDPNDKIYAGADDFFDEISKEFGRHPNVIYEIMNEPNGDLDWAADLKPYAERIAATIRANDPDNLILVGSGTWSQEVDAAAADPLSAPNVAYTFHFYAGTHGDALRGAVDRALASGQAVFCSEWGTTTATGDHGLFFEEAEEWLDFMDERGISWVNWNLGAKDEDSAAFKVGSILSPTEKGPGGLLRWPDSALTENGAWIRAKLRSSAGR